ncbi:MAG: lipid A biosynthesis acyltransferase [Pseudomonadota bacterium]
MSRLGFLLLRLLHALLPASVLGNLGGLLGGLIYYLARERRIITLVNLGICFPDWPDARRRAVARAHFRLLARAYFQDTVSWWGSRADVERLTRLEGTEHYLAHAGKPVIWLAPHFVGLNVGGVRVTAEYAPIVSLYARIKNPHLDKLMLQARTRFTRDGQASEMYSRRDGIKPVIRAIKRGLPFYYLPDLDYGRKDAIFVPFFGHPAATITGLSRLARATGAVVVPCITRRDGNGWTTRFYPAWDGFPSNDVEADTRRMNAFIEDRVREMPEQYFWLHRRFKTQPEGKKGRIYAD